MTRAEKIRLLHDIAKGKSSIQDLLPFKMRTWQRDEKDNELFHCKAENLTWRKDEQLPGGNAGWRFIDIFVYKCGPPIAECE